MPVLAELKEVYQDRSFEIIGIFADNIRNLERGISEKEKAGLNTTCILVNESMIPAIENVQYVPYLYFVDNHGETIDLEKVGKSSLEELIEAVDKAFDLVNN